VIRLWGLAGLVTIALWIFCIFDVIAADESLVRNLPKTMWLMLVIFIPTLGSIAWLALGRPQNVGWTPGSTDYRAPRRAVGPEDSAGWSSGNPATENDRARQLRAWEAELQRREDDLRRRGEADPPPDPTAT
jgi:hypothetical protein